MFSKHWHLNIVGFIDFHFVKFKLDRCLLSDICHLWVIVLMTWKSKKQNTEAEYRALYHANKKLIWLCIFLRDLGYGSQKRMMLCYDNTTAIEIFNNLVQYDWTKHNELDRNYVKVNLNSSITEVFYMDQLANIITHIIPDVPFHLSLSTSCKLSLPKLVFLVKFPSMLYWFNYE